MTTEPSKIDGQSLSENAMEYCNIDNKKECESNELCVPIKEGESIGFCKFPQDEQINNNANSSCSIVCKNGNLTKLSCYEIDLKKSSEPNPKNTVDIEMSENEKCKAEVHQFYQNLKLELRKYQHFFKDKPAVKHVAHLEIEASKKKEFEIVVSKFEKKRVDSPNPFLFVEELKNCVYELDQI